MEGEPGILRIGIPTGVGTKGVRKEDLIIAKNMLSEMTSEYITQKWGQYYVVEYDNLVKYLDLIMSKWGMVLEVKVPNLTYAKAIMKSFEYDIIDIIKSSKI